MNLGMNKGSAALGGVFGSQSLQAGLCCCPNCISASKSLKYHGPYSKSTKVMKEQWESFLWASEPDLVANVGTICRKKRGNKVVLELGVCVAR